jgi:coenzyme F420-reducing hydrogenase gamma subunit
VSDHLPVDFELRGCPIDKGQLLELTTALLGAQARDPRAQRLPRLQAARHVVRDGGARHAVPRTYYPGLLRRDLSRLRRGRVTRR